MHGLPVCYVTQSSLLSVGRSHDSNVANSLCLYIKHLQKALSTMRTLCGIKTIKGLTTFAIIFTAFIVVCLLQLVNVIERLSKEPSASTKKITVIVTVISIVFAMLMYIIFIKNNCLARTFPVFCGHRKLIFSGTSSIPLNSLLLNSDKGIPSADQVEQVKEQAMPYLDDIKAELEKRITRTKFEYTFSGSTEERFGVPLSHKKTFPIPYTSLYSDLDIMFCCVDGKASFSADHGNISVEPYIFKGTRFVLYAHLTSLSPDYEGRSISSGDITRYANLAVGSSRVTNLPGRPCCNAYWCNEITLKYHTSGPAIKIDIPGTLEADITVCIKCDEWPPFSDWPDRPRNWPAREDVTRIAQQGCHLVAKHAPSDEDQKTWRISFSVAEVELSKLLPDTARRCFLALKVILKDHLQPVVPELATYHVKTILLNTLEKNPQSFWVDENIEECFLTLLKELFVSLDSKHCQHHWFSEVNLFSDISYQKGLAILARKVKRILCDPAPFIWDDGRCCLCPCTRVPENKFHKYCRRTSQVLYIENNVQSTEQIPNPPVDPCQYITTAVEEDDQYPAQLLVALPAV